jgi:hypothetical protein
MAADGVARALPVTSTSHSSEGRHTSLTIALPVATF